MSKYHAQPTVVDGIRFASKAEARQYRELRLREMAGEIGSLSLQPAFYLHVRDIRIGQYVSDFQYYDHRAATWVVHDVKGIKTPMYRWKKKHLFAEYGIVILETK